MCICWYCHWGWSKPVANIYKEAVKKLNGNEHALHYGGAHIVWEDENFETHHIQWCLDTFEEHSKKLTLKEKTVVKWSLEEMLKLPEDIRCIEPDDYDDMNPENYPPKCETEKI